MDLYPVSGFANFLHKHGAFVLLCNKGDNTVGHGGAVDDFSLFIGAPFTIIE